MDACTLVVQLTYVATQGVTLAKYVCRVYFLRTAGIVWEKSVQKDRPSSGHRKFFRATYCRVVISSACASGGKGEDLTCLVNGEQFSLRV